MPLIQHLILEVSSSPLTLRGAKFLKGEIVLGGAALIKLPRDPKGYRPSKWAMQNNPIPSHDISWLIGFPTMSKFLMPKVWSPKSQTKNKQLIHSSIHAEPRDSWIPTCQCWSSRCSTGHRTKPWRGRWKPVGARPPTSPQVTRQIWKPPWETCGNTC